jgi:transposase-like protein
VQILHPFSGSLQQYEEALADPDRYRPDHCPQCDAQHPLRAHGFYRRTLVETGFDGVIRVRRYLCRCCQRTVSLLPQFALPYFRFSVVVIALFLRARLLEGRTLVAAAVVASLPRMPYQRGQFWVRRFRRQAEALCAALTALTAPPPAPHFVARALLLLQAVGGIAAHRFLFSQLRVHLLGWPAFLAPRGRRATLGSAGPPGEEKTHSTCLVSRPPPA